MWWFDESLYRDNLRQRANYVYRSGPWISHVAPVPATDLKFLTSDLGQRLCHKPIPLTEAQLAANKILLESGAGLEAEHERLLIDLQALEKGIRDQKSHYVQQLTESETQFRLLAEQLASLTNLAEASDRANEELQRTHKLEMELLSKKYQQTCQESSDRETRLNESLSEAKRLQNRLAKTEQTVVARDKEINELQLQIEAVKQDFATQLATAESEFNRDRKHLNALVTEADQRVTARAQLIHELSELTEQLEFTREVEQRDLLQQLFNLQDAVSSSEQAMREAEDRLGRQSAELTALQADHEKLETEYIQVAEQLSQLQAEYQSLLSQRDVLLAELATQQEEQAEFERQHAILWAESQDQQDAAEAQQLQTDLALQAAEKKSLEQAALIFHLTSDADLLRSENEQLKAASALATDERSASQAAFAERERSHARQLTNLTFRIDSLKAERDAAVTEAQNLRNERDTVIKEAEAIRVDNSAAKERQRAQAEELKKAFFRLREEAEARNQAATNATVLKLTDALQRQQDVTLEQVQKAKELEYDLRKRCDQLESELAKRDDELAKRDQELAKRDQELAQREQELANRNEELAERNQQLAIRNEELAKRDQELAIRNEELAKRSEELGNKSEEFESKVSQLQDVLEKRRLKLESLATKTATTSEELKRRSGAIEKIQQEKEHLVKLHTAQFHSLQSRVDQLLVELNEEKQQRQLAENEARRLCVERSRRIGFLSRQRQELVTEVKQLRYSQAEKERLVLAAGIAQGALTQLNDELSRKSRELNELRLDFETAKVRGQQLVSTYQLRLEKAQRQIEELTSRSVWAHRELRRYQERLEASSDGKTSLEPDLTIVERDRIIATLEQNAMVMQQRLQREAAERRKLEALIKRESTQTANDIALRDGWTALDTRNQIERLQRQITALKNINALERQRSEKELARYKQELLLLKASQGQQRAA